MSLKAEYVRTKMSSFLLAKLNAVSLCSSTTTTRKYIVFNFSSILRELRPVQGVSWMIPYDNTWQKQSSMICSEQTTKWPVGLKFLRCGDTNLFQLDKTLPLGGELCKEIPSRGFEPLLQSCTTQRLAGLLLSGTS